MLELTILIYFDTMLNHHLYQLLVRKSFACLREYM
jgi:hypothetical protein